MSIRIDVNIGDERLRRNNKRRTAANQQALDARTQSADNQQAAEQAAQEATPVERPGAVPDLRLQRRPAAQRRRQQLQLDPIIIRSDTPNKRTYTIISGSEGAIYSISPYLEPGLPQSSTELVPGLRDSIVEAAVNFYDGGEVVNAPILPFLIDRDAYNEFYTYLRPNRSGNTTLVGDVTKIDKSFYFDVLAGAYIVNDTLQLIFYRSFTDAYDATFTFSFNYTVIGVPTSSLINAVSSEIPKAVVNCLAVTLNLKTKEVKKSSFTFYTFETLRVTKSRQRVVGAFNFYGQTRAAASGYINWRDYEENVYTKELLNFLSSSFPSGVFPFDALPVFIGNYQENYKHTYSDDPAEPRTATGGILPRSGVLTALTANPAYLNPSRNLLASGKYHDLFSFLPYANPVYANNVTPVFDTFNFVSVPRWASYDTRSSNRIVYGGQTAQPPDFSLLELEKVPLPSDAQSLKKYSYPWPQSFVAYNEGRATITSQQGFVKLNTLSAPDLERVLSAPVPRFAGTARDLTAPSILTTKRTLVVNGLWSERFKLSSLPGAIPLPTRIFNQIPISSTGRSFSTYLIPSVLYRILQK